MTCEDPLSDFFSDEWAKTVYKAISTRYRKEVELLEKREKERGKHCNCPACLRSAIAPINEMAANLAYLIAGDNEEEMSVYKEAFSYFVFVDGKRSKIVDAEGLERLQRERRCKWQSDN